MKEAKGILVVGDDTQSLPAVVPDSPADKAGIEEGDVILKLNNDAISQSDSFIKLLSKYNPGDEIELRIVRNGEEKSLKVKLGESSS
jgi:S1-C subfamily serine protease